MPGEGSKEWWDLMRHSYGKTVHTILPPLLKDHDCFITDPKDKANVLSDYFCSHSTLPDPDAPY